MLNEVRGWDPNLMGVFYKRHQRCWRRGRTMWGHSEVAICSPERQALGEETKHLDHGLLASRILTNQFLLLDTTLWWFHLRLWLSHVQKHAFIRNFTLNFAFFPGNLHAIQIEYTNPKIRNQTPGLWGLFSLMNYNAGSHMANCEVRS